VHSAECAAELDAAVRHHQRVIPTVLPDVPDVEGPAALPEVLRLTGADPNNPAAVRRVQKRVVMRFHPERWAS